MWSVRWKLPLIVQLKSLHFLEETTATHRFFKNTWLTLVATIDFKQLQESCILIWWTEERLGLALHSWCCIHTLTAKHKQSRAAIPNPIVVNMKPASFRRWGEFGPHIPIRPVSKAILHNAAQRTAAEQDFDFPQCDSNFIFLWKATWLLRLESRDERWRAVHNNMLVWSFAYNFSNK